MTIREELEKRLQSLALLTRRKSRFGDSHSYFLADREIAHFHGDERMDVRLTRERIREMKSEGTLDPRVRTRGPSADWAAVRVAEEQDLSLAVQLVEDAIRANS
jgi:luciferase-like monooxygenase